MGLKRVLETFASYLGGSGDNVRQTPEFDRREDTADEDELPRRRAHAASQARVSLHADDDIVTDENRILRLLIQHDGRVEKSTLVAETGWSEAKVEEVLSSMRSDQQITTIASGRKQVICRRGYEPEGHRPLFNR